MLQISETTENEELVVETKDVPLNFDSRVARGLVVTVRALDGRGTGKSSSSNVSVSISAEQSQSITDELLLSVAKQEILWLERKRKSYPNSRVLLNQLASLYSYIGDYEAALSILQPNELKAGDDLIKYRMALVQSERKDFYKADQIFKELSGQWRLPSLLGRAYISVCQGEVEAAKVFVNDALQVDFFDYGAQLMAGAVYLWDKSFGEAVRCFKIASEERPKSAIPLVHMAVAYFALNQTNKAITTLKKAIFLNPLDDKAVLFFADLLIRTGKSNFAITPLKQLYELWGDQTRGEILDRLAKVYLDISDPSKALQILQKRVTRDPQNPFLLNNAGIVQLKRGHYSEGKAYFNEAADRIFVSAKVLTSQIAFPILNYLTLLLRREDYSNALPYFKKLLSDNRLSENDDLRYELLVRYLEALSGGGDVSGSIKLGEKLLSSEVNKSNPFHFKVSLFLLHQYSVVVPNRDRALSLAADVLNAWSLEEIDEELRRFCVNNAIFSMLQFDDVRQAALHLSKIEKYVAKDSYVTGTWGLYYLRKNNFSKAKTLYERAIEIAADPRLKARIRQRMALEFAKQYALNNDNKEALYWSGRAAREKEGLPYVREESERLRIKLLSIKNN